MKTHSLYRHIPQKFHSILPRTIILLYHHVNRPESDPQALSVSPASFTEHMEILRRYTHPLPLSRLVRDLKKGNIQDRSVVVTFDDGYRDNLYEAKPVLDRYGIPATVFVTTGYIDGNREFWWDELEKIFLCPGVLPEKLELKTNCGVYRQDLKRESRFEESLFQNYLSWDVRQKNNPTSRHEAYRSLCNLLRPLREIERENILEQLREWAGVKKECRPDYRVLSPNEILRLVEKDLIEVGAHTEGHFALSSLGPTKQKEEIEKSKRRLEDILGYPVNSFAYPFGTHSDYTAKTVDLLKKAGFTCACSNFPDLVWRFSRLFELPRIVVRDWNGEQFYRNIIGWFEGKASLL